MGIECQGERSFQNLEECHEIQGEFTTKTIYPIHSPCYIHKISLKSKQKLETEEIKVQFDSNNLSDTFQNSKNNSNCNNFSLEIKENKNKCKESIIYKDYKINIDERNKNSTIKNIDEYCNEENYYKNNNYTIERKDNIFLKNDDYNKDINENNNIEINYINEFNNLPNEEKQLLNNQKINKKKDNLLEQENDTINDLVLKEQNRNESDFDNNNLIDEQNSSEINNLDKEDNLNVEELIDKEINCIEKEKDNNKTKSILVEQKQENYLSELISGQKNKFEKEENKDSKYSKINLNNIRNNIKKSIKDDKKNSSINSNENNNKINQINDNRDNNIINEISKCINSDNKFNNDFQNQNNNNNNNEINNEITDELIENLIKNSLDKNSNNKNYTRNGNNQIEILENKYCNKNRINNYFENNKSNEEEKNINDIEDKYENKNIIVDKEKKISDENINNQLKKNKNNNNKFFKRKEMKFNKNIDIQKKRFRSPDTKCNNIFLMKKIENKRDKNLNRSLNNKNENIKLGSKQAPKKYCFKTKKKLNANNKVNSSYLNNTSKINNVDEDKNKKYVNNTLNEKNEINKIKNKPKYIFNRKGMKKIENNDIPQNTIKDKDKNNENNINNKNRKSLLNSSINKINNSINNNNFNNKTFNYTKNKNNKVINNRKSSNICNVSKNNKNKNSMNKNMNMTTGQNQSKLNKNKSNKNKKPLNLKQSKLKKNNSYQNLISYPRTDSVAISKYNRNLEIIKSNPFLNKNIYNRKIKNQIPLYRRPSPDDRFKSRNSKSKGLSPGGRKNLQKKSPRSISGHKNYNFREELWNNFYKDSSVSSFKNKSNNCISINKHFPHSRSENNLAVNSILSSQNSESNNNITSIYGKNNSILNNSNLGYTHLYNKSMNCVDTLINNNYQKNIVSDERDDNLNNCKRIKNYSLSFKPRKKNYSDVVDFIRVTIPFEGSQIYPNLINNSSNNVFTLSYNNLNKLNDNSILYDGNLYKVVNTNNGQTKLVLRYFQITKNCFRYYKNIYSQLIYNENPLVQFDLRQVEDIDTINVNLINNLVEQKIEFCFSINLINNTDFFVFATKDKLFGECVFNVLKLIKKYYEDEKYLYE